MGAQSFQGGGGGGGSPSTCTTKCAFNFITPVQVGYCRSGIVAFLQRDSHSIIIYCSEANNTSIAACHVEVGVN